MRVPDRRLYLWREALTETHQQHRKRMLYLYLLGFAAGTIVGHSVLRWQVDSTVRFALVAGAFSVLLGWLFIERPAARRLFRERTGICVHCGYNLRATPDRCPECGAVPARSQNWD